MGIVAFYIKQYEIGRHACLKAIEIGLNSDLDKSNLKFYDDKIKEIKDSQQKNTNNMTKKDFTEKIIVELKQKFPRMTHKQLKSMANGKWKHIKMNKK